MGGSKKRTGERKECKEVKEEVVEGLRAGMSKKKESK